MHEVDAPCDNNHFFPILFGISGLVCDPFCVISGSGFPTTIIYEHYTYIYRCNKLEDLLDSVLSRACF